MRCKDIGEDIWRCRLDKKDIYKLKIGNQFWKEVLIAWNEFNMYHQFRVENQLIWYNSDIKVSGKVIFWKDVYDRGLKYVYQLYDDKEFKRDEIVLEEFGLSKMRYNSLKVALPKQWKEFFSKNSVGTFLPLPPHNYDLSLTIYQGCLSRKVYQFLAEDVIIMHNKYLKWVQELGPSFCEGIVDFGLEIASVYRLTNITKYRSFQYRLIQRGLVTNIHLYKWKMVDSELCYFCNTQKETISHIMYQCTVVQTFWRKVEDYLCERFGIMKSDIVSNEIAVMWNKIVPSKFHVANFVCLVTKQYIYRCKCQKKDMSFEEWKQVLRQIESVEKYIAIQSGRYVKHVRKWNER